MYFPSEGIELATLRVTPRPHPVIFLEGKPKAATTVLAVPSLFSRESQRAIFVLPIFPLAAISHSFRSGLSPLNGETRTPFPPLPSCHPAADLHTTLLSDSDAWYTYLSENLGGWRWLATLRVENCSIEQYSKPRKSRAVVSYPPLISDNNFDKINENHSSRSEVEKSLKPPISISKAPAGRERAREYINT